MKRAKRRYRYWAVDENGTTHFATDDLSMALTESIAQDLELRKRLPNVQVGKRKIINRFTVIRKITSQIEIFT